MMEKYLDLLQKLIRFQPVSADIAAVNRVEETLYEFLKKAGLYCVMEEWNGRKVLYAATQETKTPDLLMNAHCDVVAPSEPGQFEPYIKDGWVYGRGTTDCLGNVIVMVKTLCECDRRASVGAVFTANEEIGGETTGYMAEKGYIGQKLICIIDGGANAICCGQKGTLSIDLIARGRGGHSSQPWSFDNPVDKLIEGYSKLKAVWKNPEKDDTWHKSMAATIIKGGNVGNQIPDEAMMHLNFRLIAESEREEVINLVRETTGLEVHVQEGGRAPLDIPFDNPELEKFSAVMEKLFGFKPPFLKMNGATDACWFAEYGKPIIIIGTCGAGCHGKGEKAEIASLELYSKLLIDYADQCL